MSQDFQKREAKRSLWDMDGQRVKKKSRNKGKGRAKDKKLIQEELEPLQYWEDEIMAQLYRDDESK